MTSRGSMRVGRGRFPDVHERRAARGPCDGNERGRRIAARFLDRQRQRIDAANDRMRSRDLPSRPPLFGRRTGRLGACRSDPVVASHGVPGGGAKYSAGRCGRIGRRPPIEDEDAPPSRRSRRSCRPDRDDTRTDRRTWRCTSGSRSSSVRSQSVWDPTTVTGSGRARSIQANASSSIPSAFARGGDVRPQRRIRPARRAG